MNGETGGVQPPRKDEAGRVIVVVIGAALVLVGLSLMAREFLWPWLPFARVWSIIRDAGWGLGLIIVGVLAIIWSQRRGFTAPAKGARLYRSRSDRVLGGVLGGIAEYLSADPTLVRLAFVGLALMFGVWPAVIAYIIAVLIVPEVPLGTTGQAPPAPPRVEPPVVQVPSTPPEAPQPEPPAGEAPPPPPPAPPTTPE
jgi:phage shock protein C